MKFHKHSPQWGEAQILLVKQGRELITNHLRKARSYVHTLRFFLFWCGWWNMPMWFYSFGRKIRVALQLSGACRILSDIIRVAMETTAESTVALFYYAIFPTLFPFISRLSEGTVQKQTMSTLNIFNYRTAYGGKLESKLILLRVYLWKCVSVACEMLWSLLHNAFA